MKYLFELSKEHPTIPKAEILSCLKAEKINYKILEKNDDILLIDIKNDSRLNRVAERLSYTFFIDSYLFSSSIDADELSNVALKHDINQKGSIAVKYKNRSKFANSKKIVETLANIYTKDRKVDLINPYIEIRALITEEKIYVGCKKFEINRSEFETRKVQYRPFFSPISLHPKIARALVNLSCIKKGEILLDPFCGTGGILLEAGILGVNVVGGDIKDEMVEGCKKTLEHYKIKNFNVFCSDIENIGDFVKNVDCVVTDFPYAKSTTTKGENLKDLCLRSFDIISKIVKKRGRVVVGLHDLNLLSIGKKYMDIDCIYEIPVHRSLTRFFAVFIN